VLFYQNTGCRFTISREEYGTALHATTSGGGDELSAVFIVVGVDINADVVPYGTAIEAAFQSDADEHILYM
jgi:hypothetical protein